MKEYLLPVKIVASKQVTNAESLFVGKGMYPVQDMNVENWKKNMAMEGLGASVTLDFGKEMHGGVRLFPGLVHRAITQHFPHCKVRIRFGESLGEVNSSLGEKNAGNAHSPRDFELYVCSSSDMLVGQTGFRFVRIDLLEDRVLPFRNIYCENNIFSGKPIYTYQGKDERIKEIFDVARRTVELCASTGYIWDGIKRDRLVWAGDLAPEVMALCSIYGKLPAVEKSLDLSKKLTPLPYFMNGIYTYSMWWIIILADYFKEFSCENYLKKQLKYLEGLLPVMDGLVDEKGDLNTQIRYLVDWPTRGTADELTGVRAIFLMAMNGAESLLRALHRPTEMVEKIRKKLLLQPMNVEAKKQVIALKYFAIGEITDEEYAKLIEGGAKGFSTFMSYYILTAIASRDEALAIKLMKEYYGGMLDRGATTFWEDFNVEWLDGSGRIDEIDEGKKDLHGDYGAFCYVGFRHSLCHGWSAGVVKFIKEHCR